MLHRLIFNILTVPTYCVSGSAAFVDSVRMDCEYVLESTINRILGKNCQSSIEFVNAATRNGTRCGEDFLGYKERSDVHEYVKNLYEKKLRKPQVANTSVPPLGLSHRRHKSRKSLTHITEATKRKIMEGGSKSIAPCVILFNGFPAVGKLTTAMALQRNILSPTRLVDNHQWIDAACSVEPNRNAPQYRVLCNSIRDLLFGGLKTMPDKDTSIIMTNSLAMELKEDSKAFAEHVDIARARGVPFIVISLTCNEAVNKVRLRERDVDRKTESMAEGLEPGHKKISLKTKLKSPDILSSLLQQYTLLDPAAEMVKNSVQGVKFRHLELDTSNFSASESVDAVLKFLGSA